MRATGEASSPEEVAASGHPGRSGVTYRVHQGLRIKQIISDRGKQVQRPRGKRMHSVGEVTGDSGAR